MDKQMAMTIMGLENDYTEESLKTRYKTLSKIVHPDVNGDSKLFMLIKESYDFLYNSENNHKEHINKKQKTKLHGMTLFMKKIFFFILVIIFIYY